MTAQDAFAYLKAEGAIRLNTLSPTGLEKVLNQGGARAEDLLEFLYKQCRMPMKMVAEWSDRLEMEDLVRDLVKEGTVQFDWVVACYRVVSDPKVTDLDSFLICRRGTSMESPVRTEWREWARIIEHPVGRRGLQKPKPVPTERAAKRAH